MECSAAPIESLIQSHQQDIAEKICQWGHSPSVTILDPVCEIFRSAHIDGIIGYRNSRGCHVVFGDPIAAPENVIAMAEAFKEFSQSQKKSIVYLTASPSFTKLMYKKNGGSFIEVAEELTLDPHSFPKQGSKGRLLRKKMNHASHEGVIIKEYSFNDSHTQNEIESVGEAWLKGRHGPQIYFAHVHLFDDKMGKRWFYAEKEGRLVGVALLNRLDAENGWLLHMLMATPDAPSGTSESLVLSIMEVLTQEGCHFLSFGATPSDHLGEIKGMGRVGEWLSRYLFKSTKHLFQLDGRRNYWKKFDPQSIPSFLYCSKPSLGPKEIYGVMKAMNVSLKT